MVSIQNRFLSLPDDDDGEVQQVKVVAPVVKETPKAAPAPAKPAKKEEKTTLGYEEPKGKPRGGKPSDHNRGGGKGGRGGARGSADRKHESKDRRSGTGRRDNEKKETNGPGTWGKEGDEKADKEKDGDVPEKAEKPEKDAEAAPVEEAAPEEPQKSLEEYKAEQAAARANFALPEARKAGEGSDKSLIRSTEVFTKEEPEDIYGSLRKTKKEVKSKTLAKKDVIELDHKSFKEEQRRDRDREGRPNRGKGGKGGAPKQQGNRKGNNAPPPKMNDSQFPSLGEPVKV